MESVHFWSSGPSKDPITESSAYKTGVHHSNENEAEEIIIALNANIEGDTTAFYLARKLQKFNLKISTISKGISVGSELEYTDEITLGRSLTARVPYSI